MTRQGDEIGKARDIYSVSRLNREVRTILEGSFPLIWIEGEISNLSRPASRHWYFSLKDEAAQVRCAMFRNRNMLLKFTPENGMQVQLRARISLYEARGDFQLIAEHMEEAGGGALQRAFEELKQRLHKEGVFDAAHKKTLPAKPKCIGIITSPSGAAIRDILTTLKRRFPALPVVVYPVPVQGEGAAEKIATAIQRAGERQDCDVLILARGGGSLEDLWAFNEERVARAIYQCPLPVVCGVGHEIDFTIADFVADYRAPTPTAAAEVVSPDQTALLHRLQQLNTRLSNLVQNQVRLHQQKLQWLHKRLIHPGRRLQDTAQRLDELELRMQQALKHHLRHKLAQAHMLGERLQQHNPVHRLQQLQLRQQELSHRLYHSARHTLEQKRQQLHYLSHHLDAVSPLATLNRGYAIVTTEPAGKLVRSASQLQQGQTIRTRLASGQMLSKVEKIEQ